MYKHVINENGKVQIVVMTLAEEESFKQQVIWHNLEKPIQVIISEEIKSRLLMLKQEHDILGNHSDVATLLDYVKNISALSVNDGGNLYIYLSEIFPEHKAFLESFGIQINQRP